MDPVNSEFFKNVQDIIHIAAGGPSSWIATGVLLLISVIGYLYLKQMYNDAKYKQGQEDKSSDKSENTPVNQDASDALGDAVHQTEENRTQEPRLPRPPRG